MAPSIELDSLIERIVEYGAADITHDELGSALGFHEAQALKRQVADYFIDILTRLREVRANVDDVLTVHVVDFINGEGRALGSIETEIERMVREDLNTPQFPGRRDSQVSSLRERIQKAKLHLQPYDAVIRSRQLERQFDSTALGELERAAKEQLAQLTETVGEARKVLANVQAPVMEKGVTDAKSRFEDLRRGHGYHAQGWFVVFTIAAGLTAWAAGHAALTLWTAADAPEAIIAVFKKLLMISLPAVLMRVALAKYNLERNLGIVYAHREAVLAQYRTFEAAIGNDTAAKNQFRLEIAKYIFSDPVTGYVTADGGAEVNINPVIGLLDKMVAK